MTCHAGRNSLFLFITSPPFTKAACYYWSRFLVNYHTQSIKTRSKSIKYRSACTIQAKDRDCQDLALCVALKAVPPDPTYLTRTAIGIPVILPGHPSRADRPLQFEAIFDTEIECNCVGVCTTIWKLKFRIMQNAENDLPL